MGWRLIYNKDKTKAKIYTTISEGDLTDFMPIDDLRNDIQYGAFVREVVDRICQSCGQHIPKEVNKRVFEK